MPSYQFSRDIWPAIAGHYWSLEYCKTDGDFPPFTISDNPVTESVSLPVNTVLYICRHQMYTSDRRKYSFKWNQLKLGKLQKLSDDRKYEYIEGTTNRNFILCSSKIMFCTTCKCISVSRDILYYLGLHIVLLNVLRLMSGSEKWLLSTAMSIIDNYIYPL